MYRCHPIRVHRTQVFLDDDQYRALRTLARRTGKSMGALIREMIGAHFRVPRPAGKDPFDEVIGIGRGDGAPVAENVSDYLYGEREGSRCSLTRARSMRSPP